MVFEVRYEYVMLNPTWAISHHSTCRDSILMPSATGFASPAQSTTTPSMGLSTSSTPCSIFSAFSKPHDFESGSQFGDGMAVRHHPTTRIAMKKGRTNGLRSQVRAGQILSRTATELFGLIGWGWEFKAWQRRNLQTEETQGLTWAILSNPYLNSGSPWRDHHVGLDSIQMVNCSSTWWLIPQSMGYNPAYK